ncbi:MAG TPA: secretin N-terminal domain-containing protein [Gemmataceae bacterium]|nr:secretin N-terminal domain-containing protein [Gemmataceae bacterium]
MMPTRMRGPIGGLLLFAWVLCSFPWLGLARATPQQQTATEKKVESPAASHSPKPRVFQLQHARARDMAEILQRSLPQQPFDSGFRAAIDDRSNSLIVIGSPQQLEIVDALLSKLDTAADKGEPSRSVRVFQLGHPVAGTNLMGVLRLILPEGSFQVDEARNQVIVRSDQKSLDAVESVLQRLDAPQNRAASAEVQVRLVWLASGLPGQEMRKPPDDMKPVLGELAKMGIKEPSLVTQTLVATMPNADFTVQGEIGLGPRYRLSVSGIVQTQPDPSPYGLRIQISAAPVTAAGVSPSAQPDPIALSTSISTPPGQLVVLGMTPTATSTSVFVIQVLPRK